MQVHIECFIILDILYGPLVLEEVGNQEDDGFVSKIIEHN